jgi:hypothetical protein
VVPVGPRLCSSDRPTSPPYSDMPQKLDNLSLPEFACEMGRQLRRSASFASSSSQ